jgi:hypothetical protein
MTEATDITQGITEIEQKLTEPKKPKKPKPPEIPFVEKSRDEIKSLTAVEKLEYEAAYHSHKFKIANDKIKAAIKLGEAEPRKIETRKAILWGKMVMKELENNSDRRVHYEIMRNYLNRYLTRDGDRQLFGFAQLTKIEDEKNENN